MRVWISGAAGFIGGATVRLLVTRGDEVIAVVRDPARTTGLKATGAEVVSGALDSLDRIAESMRGCDAAIHLAGSYRVGITAAERPAMYEANVAAAERVLDAAIGAGIGRIVYISTANVFGNTHGRVVDESYRRDLAEGFVSYYDETKYLGHVAAEERIARGAPIVIAMPGTVYGRGDHSAVGDQLRRAFLGRLPVVTVPELGITPIHVDDAAAGIMSVMDRGVIGRSYILAGEPLRLGDAVAMAARAGGHRPPRLMVASRLLGALAPVGRILPGRNVREVLAASVGVTYWASSERAHRELGFAPRDLATGLRDAFVGT